MSSTAPFTSPPPMSAGLFSAKTYLVALREFVENVRTKAFWIGILAFPIIIVLAIVVGRLLDKAKDLRTYAVIDHSPGQWLSQEVERRREQQGLERLLASAKARAAAKAAAAAAAPSASVREELERDLAGLAADDPLRVIYQAMLAGSDEELQRAVDGDPAALLAIGARLLRDAETIQRWLQRDNTKRVEVPSEGGDPETLLNQKIQNGELFAYFVLPEHPEQGTAGCRYVSNNLTDDDLLDAYTGLATAAVHDRRIADLQRTKNLTPDEARLLNQRLTFQEQKVSASGAAEEASKEEKASQFAPVAFVYLLWIAVFTAAQMLLTNTVEEKSNRLIEVLLSSVSPLQLMAGKVFGIAATGLTVVGSWVLCALLGVELAQQFVPTLGAFELTRIVGNPLYLSSFVAYFLAGYFLYAALLVGIGSACTSLKEAQNLLQPVFILLVVPLLAMVPVVQEPNGTVARVLTYIPLFTPFLMMNRAGGPPPAWEYAASTVVIAVAIALAFWGAAKIFRIGILMTGKPPKLREILGWLRAPVGSAGRR